LPWGAKGLECNLRDEEKPYEDTAEYRGENQYSLFSVYVIKVFNSYAVGAHIHVYVSKLFDVDLEKLIMNIF